MAGIANVRLLGHVGVDPTMRFSQRGIAFTRFSLAVNRSYTDHEGTRHESTEWFNVTGFGRIAETMSTYVAKGQRVWVEGAISSRTWKDAQGNDRFSMDVRATDFQLVSPPAGREEVAAQAAVTRREQAQRAPAEEQTPWDRLAADDPLADVPLPF